MSSVGNEEVYTIMLIPIESNLLIKGYLVGKQPDVAKFETSENT